MNLAGKVAVVTGASREIGAAMAEQLAAAGAAVLVSHHAEPELAAQTVARIQAAGGQAEALDADVSRVAECQALIERVVTLFGRLDILAANAGVTRWGPFLETDEQLWEDLVGINLKGAFFCAQAAARQMAKQGQGGRIVFSSSVTGNRAVPNATVYSVTKAGLQHLARVLAAELSPHRITVNALAIGATLNARNLADDPEYAAHWGAITPSGRVALPTDVANALLYLVSDGAQMVNGHTLFTDGGWSGQGPRP